MLQFTISYPPVSWAAPVFSKFGTYDIREAEKRAIRFLIKSIYKDEPIREPTVLKFKFYFKYPKSVSKKKRLLMEKGEIIPTRLDCTNMQKLYEDCLKKIVIDDDRNVAKIISEKSYAEREGIVIQVYTLKEFNNENISDRNTHTNGIENEEK
jgi:Holliday junction resolvase RusA-like endonuclease